MIGGYYGFRWFSFVTQAHASRRRWLLLVLQVLVLAAVLVGVGGTIRTAVVQLREHTWRMDALWLVASAGIYLAALTPMAWFLHRALVALGERPSRRVTLQAYFLGHLGKYVPGKALVIILRVGALRSSLVSLGAAIVASILETLTMMSVGGCLAAVLALVVLHLDLRLAVLAGAMAAVAGLPTLPPVARWLTGLVLKRRRVEEPSLRSGPATDNDDAILGGITLRLLASGWVAAGVCWIGLSWSVWAVLRALGVPVDPLVDLPLLTAAVSLSVVAGFLSLLPSGILVRDALLLQLLASSCGEANALIAAVLVRLVWLVSELGICGILYMRALGARR